MEAPAPELRGLEERINELLTRVEYGAEQFQLGFLFCENKSLLTAFEARFVTRLADEPATNTIFFRAWRAEAEQPFAGDALEWLGSARGRPGVYWLDLHAGSEIEIRKLLGLLNERRSELIDLISGLVLIVMRNSFGGEIRALVSDLWSVRSFSMTLHDEPAPVVLFVFPDPISVEIFGNPSISSKAPEPEALIRRAHESAARGFEPSFCYCNCRNCLAQRTVA